MVEPASAGSVASSRGRHLIEVARAHHLNNDVQVTLGTLDAACTAAPETVRYNGYARSILVELSGKGPASKRRRAQELAERATLTV
jgi:hypothetical protein